MATRQDCEVLVVGAGPVGLFAALALSRRGIRVSILDKMARTGVHSYALALHGSVLRLLQQYGLLESVLEKAYVVQTVGLHDHGGRRAEMRLPEAEGGIPSLVVLPQDALERLLEETLENHGCRVQWHHAVSHLTSHEDHVAVTIDELVQESLGYAVAHTEWLVAKSTTMRVPFVLGADGHRSSVRRALQIEFPQAGPVTDYTVFEFETDFDPGHEMRLILGPGTADVLWPLPNRSCRWSFQLTDSSAPLAARRRDRVGLLLGAAEYPVMTEDDLRQLIAERAPWFRGNIGRIQWQIAIRFEHRLAAAFGRDRVWLAGDAGHITGPAGAQSMNVGMREAEELASIITGILRDGQRPSRLPSYNRQRIAEWRHLLGLEGGLQPTPAADPWVRGCCDRLLPCIPASGEELGNLVQSLGLRLS
jgi:2-polyprenyl-6-methoxyphenol hydroxylase-like FAD-dependent oxidoreductase